MFRRKVQPDDEGFYPSAITAAEVRENEMCTLKIAGQPVILSRWGGVVYAFSAYCPHAAADLSKGELYKGRIDCPEHGWRFDLQTGRTLYPPDEMCRLKKYPVKEHQGQLLIKIG